jgi:hypothetical protein
LPIIVASGYHAADIRQRFKNDARVSFLGKPYTQQQLIQELRTALGDRET